jgi:hypothetical protein
MTAFTRPIVIRLDGVVSMLERIPLAGGNHGQFMEEWFQRALFENPECLPVKEIDPHIGNLIPVCTELETGAGPADILYITPTGQLVLAETKLWRNPEARRAVVAQILDYAKQLTNWQYEDLAREVAKATGKGPEYLLARVRDVVSDIDEAGFVDGINRSLRFGDFLLLIVGDGIRSGAEALVGFLERYGNLRFGFGLVEVAAFRLGADEILLQPRVLAKTEIIERRIVVAATGTVEVETPLEEPGPGNSEAKWFEDFWREFLSVLRLDDTTQPLSTRTCRSTNLYFQLPPGSNMAWISAYISKSVQQGGVYLTFSKTFDRTVEYFEALYAQREDIQREMKTELRWEREGKDNKVWISIPRVSFRDLNDPSERKRVIAYLADYSNRMVNAFRHRMEALSRERS